MSTNARTLKTADAFLHLPAVRQLNTIPTVVFFITGNPGLISYYREFLTLLCQTSQIDDVPHDHNPVSAPTSSPGRDNTEPPPLSSVGCKAVVAGFSLGGFELDDSPPSAHNGLKDISRANDTGAVTSEPQQHEDQAASSDNDQQLLRDLAYPATFARKSLYGLRDQIALCHARLDATVRYVRQTYGPKRLEHGEEPVERQKSVNVVLMGHSVGAYIALEVVRAHYQRHYGGGQDTERGTRSEGGAVDRDGRFDVISAVLLTPTIVNIARSSSGRVATPLLSYFPFFPGAVQLAASGLTGVASKQKLRWLVGRVTGMRDGSDALEATVGFLRRGGCVRQALHMARDEMDEIGDSKWGKEVWGVLEQEQGGGNEHWRAPKLYFWFAGIDHWVADVTREEIVRISEESFGDDRMVAGSRYGRPEIVIDEDEGLVHAWCIEQSVMVTKKVRVWLEEQLEFER